MAQTAIVVYYFKNSGYLLPLLKDADYFVAIYQPDTNVDKNLFVAKAYYPDGKIKYIGNVNATTLTPLHPKVPNFYRVPLEGSYMGFFHNGHKMTMRSYHNGIPTGGEVSYYPNGSVYSTRTYTSDSTSVCEKCVDKQGVVLTENGNGKWINFLDDDFKSYLTGNVVNGLEQGEWEGKQDDTLKIKGIYKDGHLKTTWYNKGDERVYLRVEQVPEFPGGINRFFSYLNHTVHYPADARENGTQGRVIIGFIAETDGSLTDLRVIKSASKSLDKEAIRVIGECPKWKPGMVDGKPVPVYYSVPINFILSER